MAVEAQRTLRLDECHTCSIHTELAAVLNHDQIGVVRQVTVDSRGRYWLLPYADLPMVFAANGEFLSIVGRKGPGPLEIQSPEAAWALPGDSIAVLELGGKVVIFDGEFKPVRTTTLPVYQSARSLVLEWPTRVLVSAEIATADQVGYPLHLFDLSSTPSRPAKSFGSDGSITPAERFTATKVLLAAGRKALWTLPQAEYQLTRWSQDFEVVETLSWSPHYFERKSNLLPGGPTRPPSPIISGIIEDDKGLLWVFVLTPSPSWREAWSDIVGRPSGEVPASSVNWDQLYQTRVDVIDPNAGAVIASHRFDREAVNVIPGPCAVFVIENDHGERHVRVIRLSLER